MRSLAVSWNFFSLKRHFPLCQDYLPVWMLYFPQWSGFTCLPPTIWANSSYSSTQSGFCKTTRTSPNATFMLIEGMNWATLTSTSFSRSQTLNCLCSIGDIANSTKARLGSGKSIWSCLIPYWKKGVMGTSPNINWWCLTNPQHVLWEIPASMPKRQLQIPTSIVGTEYKSRVWRYAGEPNTIGDDLESKDKASIWSVVACISYYLKSKIVAPIPLLKSY